jgi:RNA polymerase sigma-70 factor, ECF subfamily
VSVHEMRPTAAHARPCRAVDPGSDDRAGVERDEATALALRARDGDQDALAGFVRATQAEVWRLCSYLVDRDSADDLTQDTYLRAVRSLPGYRAQAPVRSWLLTIARRVCADEITARQRHRQLFTPTDPTDPTTPETGPVSADHAAEHSIRTLLGCLEPDRRAAFTLTQLLGYSYAEAAEITGVPVGTIRSRVARARESLITLLGEPALVG